MAQLRPIYVTRERTTIRARMFLSHLVAVLRVEGTLNLAAGRPAYQSSTFPGPLYAGYAVGKIKIY